MNLKKIVTGVAIAAAMAFSSSAYAWKLVVINDTETQVDAVYFRNKNTNMQWSNNFLNGPIPPHGYCHFTNLGYNDIQFDMRYDWKGRLLRTSKIRLRPSSSFFTKTRDRWTLSSPWL